MGQRVTESPSISVMTRRSSAEEVRVIRQSKDGDGASNQGLEDPALDERLKEILENLGDVWQDGEDDAPKIRRN